MVYIVGLTGGIASGKTVAAKFFSEQNIEVINADHIAKDAVQQGSQCWHKITEHFGSSILNSQGDLNRVKLRSIIFNDLSEKKWLESLIHPWVREKIVTKLHTAKSIYAILESPLLLETKQNNLVHRILVIDSNEETQIKRAIMRDNCSEDTIKKIIASQLPRSQRTANASDVVYNNGTREHFIKKLEYLHQQYLSLAKNYYEAPS